MLPLTMINAFYLRFEYALHVCDRFFAIHGFPYVLLLDNEGRFQLTLTDNIQRTPLTSSDNAITLLAWIPTITKEPNLMCRESA